MQSVVAGINADLQYSEDVFVCFIRKQIEELYIRMIQGKLLDFQDIQLELETVKEKGPKETVMRIAWFILWLGKDIVKANFVPDLCLIFSRIWKVLSEQNWGVKDLKNKLAWNQVYLESQPHTPNMVYFKQKSHLLPEFAKKLCEFIAKTFE